MPNMNSNAPRKAKNFKKSIGRLLQYLKPFYATIFFTMIFIVASTIIRLIGPNKLGDLTNIVVKNMPALKDGVIVPGEPFEMKDIWNICITLLILYAFAAIFTYVAQVLLGKVCFVMSRNVRKEIQRKIDRVPLKKIDKTPYGDILSTTTNDVDLIGDTLFNAVSALSGALVMFLGSLIMMFVTNWIMALCAIGSTIIGFSFMILIIKKSQHYFIEQQNNIAKLDGVVEETYAGQTVIKTYNANGEVEKHFSKVNKELQTTGWKSQFFSGVMHPIMAFAGNLGYVVVCVVGAVLAIKGKITFGVITSFMIYIRLFTNPLSQIAQAMTNMQSAAAASERIFDFLDSEEVSDESNKIVKLPEIKGNVSIQNVKFGYDADKEIIHGFSAEIKAGQKIAIVGPTGAGKTTIVNLLMRFYEVNSGSISIDGVSIQDMTRSQLRTIFSMVLQDTWLFEGTIRENLVYNMQNITTEDLDRVCKACGLDHFIKTLPKGYDTELSDETNVSVGQKQLLTIARAMLQNSPMLILDEATSNVDTRTEVLIQQAMDKLTEGRTSFVIAHRLSTIKNADLILVLKDGDVIESGNHDELIAKNGFYAELYNSQFSFDGCDLID